MVASDTTQRNLLLPSQPIRSQTELQPSALRAEIDQVVLGSLAEG